MNRFAYPARLGLAHLVMVTGFGLACAACVSADVDASTVARGQQPVRVSQPVARGTPAKPPAAQEAAASTASTGATDMSAPEKTATVAAPMQSGPLLENSLSIPVEGIPQDFAFDPSGKVLFVQALRKVGGEETGFVYRLRMEGGRAVPIDHNLPSKVVGHQGVSVQTGSRGEPLLWVSGHGEQGRNAVRFSYQAGAEPDKAETFTLFDSRYMNKSVTMPKVCVGGKYLLVRGRTSPRQQYIRLFDLAALNAGGPGDYSDKAAFEWALPAEELASGLPVQGLACDRKHVYVVIGNARPDEPKTFLKLTLAGTLEQKITDFSASREVAVGEGKQFEPEGISIVPVKGGRGSTVYVGVLSGNSRNLRFRLWPFDRAR